MESFVIGIRWFGMVILYCVLLLAFSGYDGQALWMVEDDGNDILKSYNKGLMGIFRESCIISIR